MLKQAIFAHYESISDAFEFYSSRTSGQDSACDVKLNAFLDFAKDIKIFSKKQKAVNKTSLSQLFCEINVEDKQDEVAAEANDDRALCRFEFFESIVRLSIAKFIQ